MRGEIEQVTLQRKKKKLKTGATMVLRDAPRKPTADRDGSGTMLFNGSVVCISCPRLKCGEVEEKGSF